MANIPDTLPDSMQLRASASKALFLILAGGAFVAIGVWSLGEEDSSMPVWAAWGAIVLFGLCIPLGIMQLISPSVLTLDRTSLTYRMGAKTMTHKWVDTYDFGIVTQRTNGIAAHRQVHFEAADGKGAPQAKGMASAFVGYQLTSHTRVLQHNYGLPAKKLAELLLRFRARAMLEAGLQP